MTYQAEGQTGKQLVESVIENQLQSCSVRCGRICRNVFVVVHSFVSSDEDSVSARVKVDPGRNGVSNVEVEEFYLCWGGIWLSSRPMLTGWLF